MGIDDHPVAGILSIAGTYCAGVGNVGKGWKLGNSGVQNFMTLIPAGPRYTVSGLVNASTLIFDAGHLAEGMSVLRSPASVSTPRSSTSLGNVGAGMPATAQSATPTSASETSATRTCHGNIGSFNVFRNRAIHIGPANLGALQHRPRQPGQLQLRIRQRRRFQPCFANSGSNNIGFANTGNNNIGYRAVRPQSTGVRLLNPGTTNTACSTRHQQHRFVQHGHRKQALATRARKH